MYILKQLPEDFIVEEISNIKIKEKGEYTYFTLKKKNFDTEKAILKIADFFKIQRRQFGYAGNKDRHAVTKQYVSLKGKISEHDFNDFRISIVGYGDKPISLGDLSGNKFTIVVRNLEKNENFRTIKSIINYFDEQRFGKYNLETGLSILKKEFNKAAELIDYPASKEYLHNNPGDYVNSIRKAPFKTLTMYIHAVQSYFWNEAAADFIKKKSKKFSEIKYSHGSFIFPEGEIKNIELPLLSFDTEFENAIIDKIFSRILEKNKLTLRDFIIRQLPDITPMGGKRNIIAEIKDFKVSIPEDDELNKGKKKITLSFMLGKGSYATIVVKNIF
jgi:tRNA pseudouridine13 synthase